MRKIALIVSALVLALVAIGAPKVTHAAGGVDCWADSYKLAQGEGTNVYCSGFSPLKYINVYLVEPDGTAVYGADVKSTSSGDITFQWANGIKNQYSFLLGTYTFVAQELGPAKQVLRYGKVQIENVGKGDAVSGAYLTSTQQVYNIDTDHIVLNGWGFLPGEIVTLWIQKPALCSSFTRHYVDGKNGATFENVPEVDGLGTYQVDDIKADSGGAFTSERFFGGETCLGTWRYAARGNTSGWGASTEIALAGSSVSTNAWLTPSKDKVGAFNDTIEFWASGFGANESLTCWTTSPEGRAVQFGSGGSFAEIKVGPGGSGSFVLTTGAHIISRDDPFFNGSTVDPLLSEGSPGEWHMTCRGNSSGATAIAGYTVYGYETSP